MKSLFAIEMDYRNVLKKAAELDDLAGQLDRQANKEFPGALREVSTAWKGDNANEYLNKVSALSHKMSSSAQDLRKIAGTLRTVAQNTYEAEKEAFRIATERTY